jgi:hypothetical protein
MVVFWAASLLALSTGPTVTADEVGATLQLTATGLTSGLTAQTTFTDGAAPDGSGTMTLSSTPATVTAGSIGNSFTFQFLTDNGKDYGAWSLATIVILAGWTAPQTSSSSSPGYVSTAKVGRGNVTATSVSGTGPWIISITFGGPKSANGFNLTYAGGGTAVTALSSPGTYTFTTQMTDSLINGGTLTTIGASPTLTVPVRPASRLAFTTSPQTLTAGINSGAITVQIQDAGGNPTNATSPRTMNLSTTSGGGIFRNLADTTTIITLTIDTGQNSTNFLYKDKMAATPTITPANSPLTSATQVETVATAAASKLVFTSTASAGGVRRPCPLNAASARRPSPHSHHGLALLVLFSCRTVCRSPEISQSAGKRAPAEANVPFESLLLTSYPLNTNNEHAEDSNITCGSGFGYHDPG